MAESDVERLARVESVETFRAEEALKQVDGDFEEAQTLLRKAPAAIKFRFASQEEDVYGLGVVVLELSPPSMDDLEVVVANDKNLGTVGLNQRYHELQKDVAARSNQTSAMAALSQRLSEGLNETLSPPSEDWVSLIKARNENDLQLQLEELVKNVLKQEDLVLTSNLEVGLIQDAEVTADSAMTQETAPGEESSSEREDVTLLCDLKVSPVKGEAVQELGPGDVIFVEVNEEKNDNRKLVEVLDQLKDEDVGMIPAPIDSIGRTKTGKVEITVQFGENVFGRTVAGEDMNILTPNSTAGMRADSGGIMSVLPWIVVGIGLLTIGMLLLYVWVFPL